MKDIATTCQKIKQQLSEYLDGELDQTVCAEMERHLSDCDNCRVVVDKLRKTILLYRDYGRSPAPPGARARLIHALNLEKPVGYSQFAQTVDPRAETCCDHAPPDAMIRGSCEGQFRIPTHDERVMELEKQIQDLLKRWPAHSAPPAMLQRLDELEEELERVKR